MNEEIQHRIVNNMLYSKRNSLFYHAPYYQHGLGPFSTVVLSTIDQASESGA